MAAKFGKLLDTPCLKMLIVDDEPLMRQGFRMFLDWEKYLVKQVIEAESGVEAIRISEIEKPDIVISDIRMPEIDGLELIAKLKNILPKAIFICISGYDDFEYAKQAITLGVFHYLVKPVHTAELHEVMNKCIEKIEERMAREKTELELNRKLEDALPQLRSNYILNILDGKITESEQSCLHRIEELEIDITGLEYKTFMLAPCNMDDSSYNSKSKMSILIKDVMESLIMEGRDSGKFSFKHYLLMDVDVLKGIVSWNGDTDIEGVLKAVLEKTCRIVKELFDIALICSSGQNVKRITDVHASAEEAAKILEYKAVKGQPGIWLFEDVNGLETGRPFFLSRIDQKKLLAGVENNDVDVIKQIMNEFNQTIKKLDYISVEYIYSTLLEMIISVTRFTFESGFNDNSFDPRIFAYDYFRNFKNMDDIFKWLENYIIALANRFNKFRMSKPGKVIDEITAYITKNIHMEISLNKIAEKFFYNPSYLSRLFKEEMNTNFLEYVNRIKIQKAMELLNTSNMTAVYICEKVGFKDYKYFTSIFRKFAGMTPHEYKNLRSDTI
jgi:Response regulator containing CheY-like receiver domain and AraC-type DNA-binding domain